jgi:hypothetical protein
MELDRDLFKIYLTALRHLKNTMSSRSRQSLITQ